MTDKGLVRVERESAYIVGVDDAISPQRLIEQVALIQNVMKSVMKDGEHYGKIPGCGDKPSLLKPGAEKLCFTFRMDPEFDIDVIDMGKGHREYRVKATLYAINSGNRIGSGVGSASTMESKWRFRTGPVESTGKPVPSEYWDQRKSDPIKALESIGGKGHSTKKVDGVWTIVKAGEKVENDNPADVYNTVLKMAKKRAMVDAVLTCTAASDIFTQDVEELVENDVIVPAQSSQQSAPPPPSGAAKEGAVDSATSPAVQKPPPQLPEEFEGHNAYLAHLGQLMQTYADIANCETGDALKEFTKSEDGKFKGFKDIFKLKHEWQFKNAVAKAEMLIGKLQELDDEDVPL